jgi:hypothetical protein
MNFRNLVMTGPLVSLLKKLYFFFKKISTSNPTGKQLIFAPVRVTNSMNLNRNKGNQNPTNL